MIPMESQDCRELAGEGICVGHAVVHREHAEGMPVMTQSEAEQIADCLLEQK